MYKIFTRILCRQFTLALNLGPQLKFAIALLLFSLVYNVPSASAQTIKLKKNKITYDQIFREIKKQTGLDVILVSNKIQTTSKIDVSFSDTPLKDALDELLRPYHLEYIIQNKTIVIREISLKPVSRNPVSPPSLQKVYFQGRVLDENKKPLQGATITIKGTNKVTATDKNGNFVFPDVYPGDVFIISFIGYNSTTLVLQPNQTDIEVQMVLEQGKLGDVVITGTGINRKRESFTGSAETFSGDKLKTVGNKNVIESLKTLDPAFIVVTNNAQGSNPNSAPTIQVRGETGINNTTSLNAQFNSNPNQPLFILDGFESTLQAIYDLDMNRVASITLLKDAASTALYGAKAANGVVVVETKKPLPGQLQISYTADLSFDVPDLSSYNLMNAAQKLQFEKLSGLYNTPLGENIFGKPQTQWQSDSIYNARLAQVVRGVNTDWIVIPVHQVFSERHSLQVAGGSNEIMIRAGIDYRNQNGVMKGSGRDTWAGNFDLTYRKGKINVTNILTVTNLVTNNSPYGSFANFAGANPYAPKNSTSPYLDPGENLAANPLYNASPYSISQSKTFGVNESLQAIYTFTNDFRIQGGTSFSKDKTNGVSFIPPNNTQFIGVTPAQQGSYKDSIGGNNAVSAYLTASYAKVFKKHQLTVNVRSDIESTNFDFSQFEAVGFPYGTDGNPSFAYNYPTGGRPVSTTATTHTTGLLGSLNYAYDGRILLDATYRLDGASTFGANNLYQPYYSVGLGWNLHKEAFLKSVTWIDLLKLRANIGYTGNENLGQFTSTSIYTFLQGTSPFGQGLALSTLGNPNLDWQNTRQASYGVDFQFMNGKISGYVEYFNKFTNPLAISANGALPTSTGANASYVLNVGNLTTQGADFNIRYSPVYNLKDRIIWTVGLTGQRTWSRYGGIGSKLSSLNTLALTSNSLARYQDGHSPDDIWAVKSAGIDPATGQEIFIKKDGTQTFIYNPDDIVRVGNTQPAIQGVINSTFTYKNFSVGMYVRYSLGGAVFNSALYTKVENISSSQIVFNQDARALTERWQAPGDVAQFKAISLLTTTPMTSRFVEKDNHFDGESFSLSYRLTNQWLLHNLGIQTLNLAAYTNEIFRIESILSERGIDYPYARTVSFSLNASF